MALVSMPAEPQLRCNDERMVRAEINVKTGVCGLADVTQYYRNRMGLKCSLKLCMIGTG